MIKFLASDLLLNLGIPIACNLPRKQCLPHFDLSSAVRTKRKAYFITDGETPFFNEFIKKYVATQGVIVPDKEVSLAMAERVAFIMELIWKTFRLKGHPPLYKGLINALGMEFITTDKSARQELDKTFVTIEQGLNLMRK